MLERIRRAVRTWLGLTQDMYITGRVAKSHKEHIMQLEEDFRTLLAAVEPMARAYYKTTEPEPAEATSGN